MPKKCQEKVTKKIVVDKRVRKAGGAQDQCYATACTETSDQWVLTSTCGMCKYSAIARIDPDLECLSIGFFSIHWGLSPPGVSASVGHAISMYICMHGMERTGFLVPEP